jgi:hypothetical protein
MDRGAVGDKRGSKEMDGCPLTEWVRSRLQVKFLDHYHDDPYEWQDFHECVHFLRRPPNHLLEPLHRPTSLLSLLFPLPSVHHHWPPS